MSPDSLPGSPSDIAAAIFFLVGWSLFAYGAEGYFSARPTLTSAMNRQREAWMRTMARRDLRMVDTGIMSGLQQGTAFFASSCIFAIGGCFALLGSADAVMEVLGDLPATSVVARPVFEAKVLGLVAILSYAFFKFGWAYRLFNYCSILIGAVPIPRLDGEIDAESEIAASRASRMNILAGKHFESGLRAIFFAIGYLGWFIGPWVFMATTAFVLGVLIRRQFFSAARKAVMGDL
ncbi:DUF599 family protein [Mesorhizobium sp. CAU 1732]|uniref:DUF599 domain-containing protein n=1 Tax=Mesorhizobium sp. CAU 1732 TaxID=3140358 RepID=UPI0032617234